MLNLNKDNVMNSMDYLLNEQGIYADEKIAQQLYEQARGEVKFNVRVE